MNAIIFLDYLGVFAFAISGVLAASSKKLDLFGGFIVAFVTGLGGGTLRDLLLNTEIGWIHHTEYLYIAMAGTACALVFKKATHKFRTTLSIFDTIGISTFTIIGVQKALIMDTPPEIAVLFGVITATFGGVIRDILCNEIPLIFRKEIYATACVIGAVSYVGLTFTNINPIYNMLLSGGIIVIVRTIAVVKKYSLPLINEKF